MRSSARPTAHINPTQPAVCVPLQGGATLTPGKLELLGLTGGQGGTINSLAPDFPFGPTPGAVSWRAVGSVTRSSSSTPALKRGSC